MKKMCNFCGNKSFRENHVQYIYRHDGQFLVVNNVPCEECEYCGEQYRAKKKAKKVVKLPIEEFVEI